MQVGEFPLQENSFFVEGERFLIRERKKQKGKKTQYYLIRLQPFQYVSQSRYELEEAEKYVEDKTRYGEKLMLDKEPTLLDIEKIFCIAMIEEGKDWKTKMEEAEKILEKKIEKKTMEGWVEKEKGIL